MRTALLLAFLLATPVVADDPTRVFPAGEKPKDARLGPPKTLNDYFPFTPPKDKETFSTESKIP